MSTFDLDSMDYQLESLPENVGHRAAVADPHPRGSPPDSHQLQSLGLDVPAFIGDVENAVIVYFDDAFDTLRQYLLPIVAGQKDGSTQEFIQAFTSAQEVARAALQANLADFKGEIQATCLAVPQGLSLPMEGLQKKEEPVDSEALDTELKALRREISEEQAAVAKMNRELRDLEMLLKRTKGPAETLVAASQQAESIGDPDDILVAMEKLEGLLQRADALRSMRSKVSHPVPALGDRRRIRDTIDTAALGHLVEVLGGTGS